MNANKMTGSPGGQTEGQRAQSCLRKQTLIGLNDGQDAREGDRVAVALRSVADLTGWLSCQERLEGS